MSETLPLSSLFRPGETSEDYFDRRMKELSAEEEIRCPECRHVFDVEEFGGSDGQEEECPECDALLRITERRTYDVESLADQ